MGAGVVEDSLFEVIQTDVKTMNDRPQRQGLPTVTPNSIMTSRRKFLVQCSAVAAFAAAPATVGLGSPPRIREVALDRLGFGTFNRLVGTHFHVYQSLSPVSLELIEASAGQGNPSARGAHWGEPESFSLIFRGPADRPLDQDSYPFAHERIGGFVMFFVPVWDQAAPGARFYEAFFTRPAGLATRGI